MPIQKPFRATCRHLKKDAKCKMIILGEQDLICKHIQVKKQEHRQTSKIRGIQFRGKVFNFNRLKLRKTVSILNFCIERIKQFRSLEAYCELSDICSTRKQVKGVGVSSIIMMIEFDLVSKKASHGMHQEEGLS